MTKCKKCGQSWRPPRNIVYKEGLCIPCYFIEHNFLEETYFKKVNEIKILLKT